MASADDGVPTISPLMSYVNDEGNQEEGTSFNGSAPLEAHFTAGATNVDGWEASYQWRFYLDGNTEPYLVRYDENTNYTFTKAGNHQVMLYAVFVQNGDTVSYTAGYWAEAEPISIYIFESSLNMPNAFSPNGDGINDVYKAKDGYTSITEFHAYIYNRWGQLLYDWNDPAGGWDGTYKGKDVKQGVYFCLVKARGADGRHFNIKTDVNLLRGFTESGSLTE